MSDIQFSRKDFEVEWFSGTGAGGQYRNKHQNCCRITHKETRLRATGQSYRERPANQAEAFKKLASKLLAYYAEPEEGRRSSDSVVRTYHFERGVASDGVISEKVDRVMDGALDAFLQNALRNGRPDRRTGRV